MAFAIRSVSPLQRIVFGAEFAIRDFTVTVARGMAAHVVHGHAREIVGDILALRMWALMWRKDFHGFHRPVISNSPLANAKSKIWIAFRASPSVL